MKISHCIDMMYADLDFYEKIPTAKRYGADAVEFWKWTNKDIDKIISTGIPVSVFNIDSCDEQLSYDLSRGILNAGRSFDFIRALEESIPVYKKLRASAMIVLIGEKAQADAKNVEKCLRNARSLCEAEGITLAIECLNDIDRQEYSMPYITPVLDIIKSVGSPNVKVLYDIYHQHMMKDFNLHEVLDNIDSIAHFHVADCPGRHQPGTGDVDYVTILHEINKTRYNVYIGLEYRATIPDGETFGFIDEVKNNV